MNYPGFPRTEDIPGIWAFLVLTSRNFQVNQASWLTYLQEGADWLWSMAGFFPGWWQCDNDWEETTFQSSQPLLPFSVMVSEWLGWFLKGGKQKLLFLSRSRLESFEMWLAPHPFGLSRNKESLNLRGEEKVPKQSRIHKQWGKKKLITTICYKYNFVNYKTQELKC